MTETARRFDHLMRPELVGLRPYDAPEPLEEFAARTGIPVGRIAKMDQNENPYGSSPRALAAIGRCQRLHVYPDPIQREARARLGRHLGVDPEVILVGNGSDELIEVLFRLLVLPGDRVLSATPTFSYYRTAVGVCGGGILGVERRDDFSADVDAMIAAIDERVKIVALASPNNPTGTLTPLEDLERLADAAPLLLIDEAYGEFAGVTALPLALRRDNVVVLRTFSKWAGLAGLRIGYGVFPPALIPPMYGAKPPYSVSVAATVGLVASLDDADYLIGTVDKIVRERVRLFDGLAAMPYLEPVPSAANFVLTRVTRGDARAIRSRLEDDGILIRHYGDGQLRDYIRVSVGLPEHTDRLLAALRRLDSELT